MPKEKAKLKECKACGELIAVSAKSCPHCGAKNKKPFYKKAWFWVLAIILLIGSAGGSEETDTTQTVPFENSTATQKDTVSSKAPEKSEYHVGDTLHVGDLQIVYVASGEYVSDNEYIQPSSGNRYIFLEFAAENQSATTDDSISMYNFECYADGYNAEMKYFEDDNLSATLSAGRATSGRVYFEVPENAQNIEIEYTFNVFSDKKIKFIFEGDFDSGYVLKGNDTATEGALQVGQVAESKQLKITYLNCFRDESDNMFIVPKDGHYFMTCEFEFENLSNSDQSISSFSFDCYADGIDCTDSFFRDDNLSATLSSGRKAKGTVTFEVPNDAKVVEVEYLSNFWTSNRVVFTGNVQ